MLVKFSFHVEDDVWISCGTVWFNVGYAGSNLGSGLFTLGYVGSILVQFFGSALVQLRFWFGSPEAGRSISVCGIPPPPEAGIICRLTM